MKVLNMSLAGCLLASIIVWPAQAEEAAPLAVPAAGETATSVLVERGVHRTYVDSGGAGPSIGDLLIWGPNPLYDSDNKVDTGAVTYGVCTWFNVEGDCLLYETMAFADGSTIETQGVQPGAEVPSVRTIVGGSGKYLGARGVIRMDPTDDETIWTRHIELR